ncbi:CLUMA_CG002791, isoform A [Clunio marinus]|uniref:CLUMA_CG002791, isoform A n=1 Tax=Clunio marinus TaxID=568069 RepID=A0A1J1HLM5_9DIPT|nr:CLUMA_CG002791, isoform A [Clunio marinus]
MANCLMAKPCQNCDEDGEYLVSFGVISLNMCDKQKAQLYEEVLIVITWDGNVIKLMKEDMETEGFQQTVKFLIHSSSLNLSKKLKYCPIMIDISRGCVELGTNKLTVTDCFSSAIICDEFNSQTVVDVLNFIKDDEMNATMNLYFRVQKLFDDGSAGIYNSLNTEMKKYAKKRLQTNGLDDLEISNSESELCKDFTCFEELPNHCRENLGLGENIYRIINGNLINIKNSIAPCGESCPVARKYIKEFCKSNLKDDKTPLSTKKSFKDESCSKLFDHLDCKCPEKCQQLSKRFCEDCGGLLKSSKSTNKCLKQQSSNVETSYKKNWIDRNIQEEDILEKLCGKHGINVDEIRDIGQKNECPVKINKCRKKKKKTKKFEVTKQEIDDCKLKETNPSNRTQFIKKMKRKSFGVYSYSFGETFPQHRSCLNIEQGSGDASLVPKYLGLRWNSEIEGNKGKKWSPGQINRTVRCLMKHFLNPFPYDTIPLTRRNKSGRVEKICTASNPKPNPDYIQQPTLKIQKRNGEYFVAMKPLKEREKLNIDCNPYLNCSPLLVNIKKHPEDVKKHRAKKILLEKGFGKKCSCRCLKYCRCVNERTKRILTIEMKKVSTQMNLEKELEYADLEESSDSEMEIEFTTPSASVDYRKCQPDVVHCDTQYLIKDFNPPTLADIHKQKLKALKAEKCKEKRKTEPPVDVKARKPK